MSINKVYGILSYLFSLVGFSLLFSGKEMDNGWLYLVGIFFCILSIPFMLKLVWKADKWDS